MMSLSSSKQQSGRIYYTLSFPEQQQQQLD
jgi:hypothetical protein